jgi:hypothetical protein
MSCKKCIEIKTPIFTGLTDSNGTAIFEGDYLDSARFTKRGYTEILHSCKVLYNTTKAAFICVAIDDLDDLNANYLHKVIGHTAVKTTNPSAAKKELLDFYGTDLWEEKYNDFVLSQPDQG